jgi:sugar phosphate isomerase/epimerase
MALSPLPLSYCTNVHPGRSLDEVLAGLARFTLGIRERYGQPLAAGLWLAQPVIRELDDPGRLAHLRNWLTQHHLPCYTLNAFPYGDFHSDRVKEQVYLPDWTSPARRDYTSACARVLAELLPDGADGSISTVPLGFKALATPAPKTQGMQPLGFSECCIEQLLQTARGLQHLRERTGRTIRLAIEPEPLCVLETTAETVAFFQRLRDESHAAGLRDAVDEHLGVCYDVCHQAVEFEDVAASIRQLAREHIRINKVHISCAIHVDRPGDADVRAALARYIEPRYLHQTFARTSNGTVVSQTDLDQPLTTNPPDAFRDASAWRVHFHVPVDAESLGPLRTTRPELRQALAAIPELPYAPHLEVETYTWEVLPGGDRAKLVDGFARELSATQTLLQSIAT